MGYSVICITCMMYSDQVGVTSIFTSLTLILCVGTFKLSSGSS
jgi:hypothetical protein